MDRLRPPARLLRVRVRLDGRALEECERLALRWGGSDILVAEGGNRAVGLMGYGDRGDGAPDAGKVFALCVLSEYYGKGVAQQSMNAELAQLGNHPKTILWALKENVRATIFYRECGFVLDGEE